MLITVGVVIESWVSVCLEFGHSEKATISCGYSISASTGMEEEHPQMKKSWFVQPPCAGDWSVQHGHGSSG